MVKYAGFARLWVIVLLSFAIACESVATPTSALSQLTLVPRATPTPAVEPLPTPIVARPQHTPVPIVTPTASPLAVPISGRFQPPTPGPPPVTPVSTYGGFQTPTPGPFSTTEEVPRSANVTPTPTPDESPASKLIYAALSGILGRGMAFDVELRLGAEPGDILIGYTGDFQPGSSELMLPMYSSGEIAIQSPSHTTHSDLILIFDSGYVPGESPERWSKIPVDWSFFPKPFPFTFGWDSDRKIVGQESLDGKETIIVSSKSPEINIAGARGKFDILYWIGVDDSLLHQVKVSGNSTVEDGSLLAQLTLPQGIKAGAASLVLTARYSEHGKQVEILTPELPAYLDGHQSVLLNDGRVLAGGGSGRVSGHSYIHDFEAGLWSTIRQLDEPVAPPEAAHFVKLDDGLVLAVGAGLKEGVDREDFDQEDVIGEAQIFDPATDSWKLLSKGGVRRIYPIVAPLRDGRVLVAGGFDTNTNLKVVTSAEIFDPYTGEWTAAALIPGILNYDDLDRTNQWAVLPGDGRVMVAAYPYWEPGPCGEGGGATGLCLPLYDPVADAWEYSAPTNLLEVAHGLIVLPDGRILATGLAESEDYTDYTASEIYDPATGQWTPAAAMLRMREGYRLTLLPGGRVLATGGERSFGDKESTTEIFDPSTNEWSLGPMLTESRSVHAATLLPDGRVFLSGGRVPDLENWGTDPTFTTEFIDP